MRKLIPVFITIFCLLSLGLTANAQGTTQTARITTFTTTATLVDRTQLNARTARIPVSWAVENRPSNSNLVFEQVLADNTVVNVELPRSNPFVASSGNGVAAPVPPGGSATSIKLRVRLVNLSNNGTIDTKEITLPIGDAPPPTPKITTFTTTATLVTSAALNARTARVPVSWAVENRPNNSNLVFEQVLADNTVVNVELPRSNPFVASSGNGVAAPVPPGGSATSIKLRVRLINLTDNSALDTKEITLPIGEAPAAKITTFTTTATVVSSAALNARTARVPVSWAVENRPDGTNLVFEQVLTDNSIVNVELPRSNPFVASSGNGVAAPVPPGGNATSIKLRVRLINLTDNSALDTKEITLPIGEAPAAKITTFTTTATVVSSAALNARTARVPVSWAVENRPDGTNLVFEQVLADNSIVNVELPRSNPFVASSGNGVAAPVPPGGNATSIKLRVRLINLANNTAIDTKELTIPIGDAPATSIRSFTSTAVSVRENDLRQRTARVPVSWVVDNRPDNSNLVFEQVLPDGTVYNVELPRSNPIVPSSGNGVAAPVLPGNADSILLQLRVVNLANNTTIVKSEITIPIAERTGGQFFEVITDTAKCYDGGFPTNQGLKLNDRGRVTDKIPVSGLSMSDVPRGTTSVGMLKTGDTFVIVEGPYCYRALYTTTSGQTNWRLWKVRVEATNAQGWVSEYVTGISGTTFNIELTTSAPPVCDKKFFFGEGQDCVAGQPATMNAAYQTFQQGIMVWRSDTRQVYALYSSGNGVVMTEAWDGTTPITYSEQPPSGLLLPQNGFGWVWTSDSTVRAALGWGTAAEQGYSGQFQNGEVPNSGTPAQKVVYFSLPDGRNVRFVDRGAQSTWNYVS